MQHRQEANDRLAKIAAGDRSRQVVLMHDAYRRDKKLRGRKWLAALLDTSAVLAGCRVIDVTTAELAAELQVSSQAVATGLDELAARGYLRVIRRPSRGQQEAWTVEVLEPGQPKLIGDRQPQQELFAEPDPPAEEPDVVRLGVVAEEMAEQPAVRPQAGFDEDLAAEVIRECQRCGLLDEEISSLTEQLAEEAAYRGPGRPRPKWRAWTESIEAVRKYSPGRPDQYLRACLRKRGVTL